MIPKEGTTWFLCGKGDKSHVFVQSDTISLDRKSITTNILYGVAVFLTVEAAWGTPSCADFYQSSQGTESVWEERYPRRRLFKVREEVLIGKVRGYWEAL